MREQEEPDSLNLDPVSREIEEALGRLAPAPAATLERDRILFEAGKLDAQRSLRLRLNGWRIAAGAMAAGLLLSISVHPRVIEQAPFTPVAMPSAREHQSAPVEMASMTPEPGPAALARRNVLTELPANSYGAMQRRWTQGQDADWLTSSRPIPSINPRGRQASPGPRWRPGPAGADSDRLSRTPAGESL